MLARILLASRYLLAVFFFGLMAALFLWTLRFLVKLWKLAGDMLSLPEEDFLIAILHLVDSALVASLVAIVALASYDSLVARLQAEAEEQEMRWVAQTDLANLKTKVATAIVAISSIHLLSAFLKLESYSTDAILWLTVVHMVFVVAAVLLGVLDHVTRKDKPAGPERNTSV